MKITFLLLIGILPYSVFATELPTRLLNSQHQSLDDCVQWKSNRCISFTCITSEKRDCQAQCKNQARIACKRELGQE